MKPRILIFALIFLFLASLVLVVRYGEAWNKPVKNRTATGITFGAMGRLDTDTTQIDTAGWIDKHSEIR